MREADRSPPGWAAAALFTYAVFVVYGSLVPLDFRPLAWSDAWARFLGIPFHALGVESRADWIANGVLYAPLGALGTLALRRFVPAPLAGIGGWLGAAALAVAVEFAQLAFPPRSVSLNDLLAETVGAAVGVGAAWALAGWLHDAVSAWTRDGRRLVGRLLIAYVPAYVLYSLFPFDVLLTRVEWATKLASPTWGLLWAPLDRAAVPLRLVLWTAEALAAVPVGMAVASQRRGARNAWRGAGAGALVGLAIELGQLALYSGVSQGLSVLVRTLGAAAGAAWFGAAVPGRFDRVRDSLARHAPWLAGAYLLALPLVGGWLRHPWVGLDQARPWTEVHLLPFYYHYYTSEAIALSSLSRTAAMFAPVGVLAWARRRGAAWAMAVAAALSAVMEAVKLLQPSTHPDPTNVLIAGAAAALAVLVLSGAASLWMRADAAPGAAATDDGRGPGAAPGAVPARGGAAPVPAVAATDDAPGARGGSGVLAGAVAAACCLAVAWTWPGGRMALMAVLALACMAVLWRPALALAAMPLAMPVFDLAPWSGRFFVDEFDLLCAAVLSIAWLRTRCDTAPDVFPTRLSLPAKAAVALFGAALLASVAHGWLAAAGSGVGTLSHLHSPFNGLRVAKGAAWALLAALTYRRLLGLGLDVPRAWRLGLAGGLALTAAAIVWERAAFVGLLDFAAEHRATGMFSAMARGGAFVECFVAVAASALLAGWPRRRGAAVLAAGLLVVSVFALLVTYSRNGYAALAVGGAVALVHGWHMRSRAVGGRRRGGVAVLVAVALSGVLVAWVAGSGFGRERLASSRDSLAIRMAHWQVALGIRGGDAAEQVLGAGPGRFAQRHLWSPHGEPRAASYSIGHEGANAFLSLGVGATVYVEQIVDPPAGLPLRLSIDLRGAGGPASTLRVYVCRKWTLNSTQCSSGVLPGPDKPGQWQTRRIDLPPLPAAPGAAAAWLPVKLSLATPSGGPSLDVDNVVLETPSDPRPGGWAANGRFDGAMDRWFFATDVDPPWHIHSLPVNVLFEQGWLGVLAWSALLACAVAGGVRASRAGVAAGAAALAALAAFLTSGLLNTLVDEPRFLWLVLMLCSLCLIHGARTPARAGVPAGRVVAAGGR